MSGISTRETLKTHSIDEAYQAAHSTGIVADRSSLGYLRFSGKTRLDLLNRMSTQKVDRLKSGEGAATILTTDIGRIVDRILIYSDNEIVHCLTGEGNGEAVARYLARFVFFMDDFHIEDLTAQTAVLVLYGTGVSEVLRPHLSEAPSLPMHNWGRAEIHGRSVSIHRTDPVAGDGFLIICRVEDKNEILDALLAEGLVWASSEAFDYLRIESGLPLFGHELTNEYIPLEAGLRRDISFNKGCYIGQEIIARMDSRGKLAKQLLRLGAPLPINPGAEITSEGKSAGVVTSVAAGPQGTLALGYVKSAVLERNTPLTVGEESIPVSVLPDTSS